MYSYLKCGVYDKLLKHRQSSRKTLYTEVHFKSVCKTKFSTSLQEHINLSPEEYLSG